MLWGNSEGGKGVAESSHISGASVSISLQMPKGVQTRSPFSAFRYTTARAPNPTVVTTELILDSEKNMPSHRTGAHPGFLRLALDLNRRFWVCVDGYSASQPNLLDLATWLLLRHSLRRRQRCSISLQQYSIDLSSWRDQPHQTP